MTDDLLSYAPLTDEEAMMVELAKIISDTRADTYWQADPIAQTIGYHVADVPAGALIRTSSANGAPFAIVIRPATDDLPALVAIGGDIIAMSGDTMIRWHCEGADDRILAITDAAIWWEEYGTLVSELTYFARREGAIRIGIRHDVALLMSAFAGGTIRHGWGSQWATYAEEMAEICNSLVETQGLWPLEHEHALAAATAQRLQTALGRKSSMARHLYSAPYPGDPDADNARKILRGHDVPHAAGRLDAYRKWQGRENDLRACHAAARTDVDSAVTRACDLWESLGETLNTAARNESWCSEYEQTLEIVRAACVLPFLPEITRGPRYWSVYFDAMVEVTLRVPVSAARTVEANSADDATQEVESYGYDLELSTSDIAEALQNMAANADYNSYRRIASAINDYEISEVEVSDVDPAEYY